MRNFNSDGTSKLRNRGKGICRTEMIHTRGGKVASRSYSHNSIPMSTPLHIYALNNHSRDWLVDAVPTIIQRLIPVGMALGKSTLLKIRRNSSPFCPMDILEARPEDWDGKSLSMAAHHSEDGVVLVRPIRSPLQDNPQVSNNGSSQSRSRESGPKQEAEACSPIDEGKTICPHKLPFFSLKEEAPISLPGEDMIPQYYGMVVQSGETEWRCQDPASGCDGCYLLKICRSQGASSDGVCGSMHYSLLKVCKGQSMNEQLLESWLV
ncbi:hypothetical protein CEUSTIGMA_g2509.t1 [Chlamydomonas eustigma]|uniref:Uncharacterized protein n=1 Tax=Chlamydomonas eustigma TaxID=1157962 RepID=A0A250WW94_9CHLO|nr:hypothetical protein CEUSTIGMA_g2509.t1 [Chlamydomonas eustigma]|eukprot:GAX75065.1 hypothetical protein CEUSTIGMA_g2509.t1 [Chlamydomonas eustigma]